MKNRNIAFYFLIIVLALWAFASKPLRIACVGDSITFGAAIDERDKNCYPFQLGLLLGNNYDVRNYGNSGATMVKNGNRPYWDFQQFKDAITFQPQIVIIKLGTNDSKPVNWNKEKYIADYKAMITTFRQLKSKPKIWICLPAPVYESRWDIRGEIVENEVIPAVKQIAQEMNVPVIDLNTPLAGKPELFPDKIHPNAEGAKIIAQTVFSALKKAGI